MLTEIKLTNFKCFKEETSFPLSKLTLLTGINGQGKSTLLQSLLLMRQSHSAEHYAVNKKILLNGNCVSLGTFSELRNTRVSKQSPVYIEYFLGNDTKCDGIKYCIVENIEDDMIADIEAMYFNGKLTLKKKDSSDLLSYQKNQHESANKMFALLCPNAEDMPGDNLRLENNCIFNKIHYISADRSGPQEYYLKFTLGDFQHAGKRGEFAVNMLYKKKDELVNLSLRLGEDVYTLLTQTGKWLSKIFGQTKIEIYSENRILELFFNTDSSKDRFKPMNVGFGYTYALPIIVSGLIAKEGEFLIVENPEAHLHPRAQSELTKFLARVADCGVQVFIETHSDHVLNALRVAVVDKLLQPDDLSILYFQQEDKNPVVKIPVQPDGAIEEWPDGFFDQMDKDFYRLFGI